MTKLTDCMNNKCEHLVAKSNHPDREISTWWYECSEDITDSKYCVIGASIGAFKEKKKRNKVS